jgi:lysophospholipase L1-like esterase
MEEAEKLKELNIRVHDLNDLAYFQDASNDIFLDTLHLSKEGNRLLANTVYRLLNETWSSP